MVFWLVLLSGATLIIMPYYFLRRYDEIFRRPEVYLSQESHMPKKVKDA